MKRTRRRPSKPAPIHLPAPAPRDDSLVMKLHIPCCPTCGEPAKGTCERLYGIALFGHIDIEDGRTYYEGETEIFWDEQTTDTKHGKPWLICDQGHTWLSKVTAI